MSPNHSSTTFMQRLTYVPMAHAEPHRRRRMGIGLAVATTALFAFIIIANWATGRFGFLPLGFGLEATAGTMVAGAALASRDAIQDTLGRAGVLAIIVLGSIVSFAISAPEIALASFAAFLIGETFDLAVYTPIREGARFGDRRWVAAVLSSNVVNVLVDTVVFIGIAFGLAAIGPHVIGQLVGKMYATALYLVIGAVIAATVKRRAVTMAA